jgi:hypothetical protein
LTIALEFGPSQLVLGDSMFTCPGQHQQPVDVCVSVCVCARGYVYTCTVSSKSA